MGVSRQSSITKTTTLSCGKHVPASFPAQHFSSRKNRESDAILLYLVERYDPEHKISAATEAEKYQQLQWLFFQSSGQGPYFGQAAWFIRLHSEQIPSAQERYRNEIKRIWAVLESVLSKQEWLVGDKCTVSDISFIP